MDVKAAAQRERVEHDRVANEMYGRKFDELTPVEQREVARGHHSGGTGDCKHARPSAAAVATPPHPAGLTEREGRCHVAGADPEPRHSVQRRGHESRGDEAIHELLRDDDVEE
jgi:hypothetical protein